MAIVWILAVIGLALAAAGGWGVFAGFEAVLVERSWAQMVGGSVSLAAGAVIFAMALALIEVVRVRRALSGLAAAAPIERDVPQETRTRPRDISRPPAPEPMVLAPTATPPPAAAPAPRMESGARPVLAARDGAKPGAGPVKGSRDLDEATDEVERALSSIIAAGAVAGSLARAGKPSPPKPPGVDLPKPPPPTLVEERREPSAMPPLPPPKLAPVPAPPPPGFPPVSAAPPLAIEPPGPPPLEPPQRPAPVIDLAPRPPLASPPPLEPPATPVRPSLDLLPIHDDLARLLAPPPLVLAPAPPRPEMEERVLPPPIVTAPANDVPAPVADRRPETPPEIPGPPPPAAEPPLPAAAPPPVAGPAPPPRRADIVRSFVIGGNTYTIYADGSIAAATPDGPKSFASFDEMRHFIDEQAGARKGGFAAG